MIDLLYDVVYNRVYSVAIASWPSTKNRILFFYNIIMTFREERVKSECFLYDCLQSIHVLPLVVFTEWKFVHGYDFELDFELMLRCY